MTWDELHKTEENKCENPKVEGSIASRQNRKNRVARMWYVDVEAWYKT